MDTYITNDPWVLSGICQTASLYDSAESCVEGYLPNFSVENILLLADGAKGLT